MPQSTQCIVIASTEAYSGKSAIILGLMQQLRSQNLTLAYSKPVGTAWHLETEHQSCLLEDDLLFVEQSLGLSKNQVRSPILFLDGATLKRRISGEDTLDYQALLKDDLAHVKSDLVLMECPNTLWEGSLFDLSTLDVADFLDAQVLLVTPYHPKLLVDSLLTVKRLLGDRLLGVVINKIPADASLSATTELKPFLEQQGIGIYGLIPANRLLRSISVREIARRLDAEILCRGDRLDLMVESLTIGAMNVNSALKFFRQRQNMVVVTGGDRTDLQLAAMETSTQCLVLTGHVPPQPSILSRAEDLEIPILSVNYDTLTTVEIIDQAFDHVRIQEPIKVECAQQLVQDHFDLPRLIKHLKIPVS